MKRLLVIFLIFAVAPFFASAQTTPSIYQPQDLFSPNFYAPGSSQTRSADGSPNAGYWQNRADYRIDVNLDENTDRISGTVVIAYTNNSPNDLSYLWLQLDQNLFSADSRGQARMPVGRKSRYGDASSDFDGGYKFESVQLNGVSADYLITDTRMQIRLREPLAAKGGTASIAFRYHFILPEYGADRCGILDTKNGKIYAVAQWYPRMCVYDDVLGWNTDPYLGPSEFYCEYGQFEYRITAPATHVVVGSGILQNESEVLSAEQQKRMNAAKKSDKTVMIRNAGEVAKISKADATKTKTWAFKMENSRDIAWASSAAFIWDAARINLPDGQTGLAQSVYPVESDGKNKWSRSTEYTKASIENYSKRWYPYPYHTATNVACNISGMEYPGVSFCGYKANGSGLWGVTDHEFGHNWFPMIVGSNERLYGWMDEGFNTFINDIAALDFNGGEYANRPIKGSLLAQFLFGPQTEGIALTPDAMKEANIGGALYMKPGYALGLLRDYILGEDRFDFAFKTYIKNWAYKHPTPQDFFNTMNNASGENLNWFWKAWFEENYKLDMSISDVSVKEDGKSVVVRLENLQQMAMPVLITYSTVSGKKFNKTIPVEIWNNTSSFRVQLDATEKILSVEIDPDQKFPEMNFENNRWVTQ